jgi:hypothetical protein
LRAIKDKTMTDRTRNTHTSEKSSGWRIYRTKSKQTYLRWYRHVKKNNAHRIPKKITGNEDDWKKTQGWTTNMVTRASYKRH